MTATRALARSRDLIGTRAAAVLLVAATTANLAFGKMFAYLRLGPLYVGELTLAAVTACLLWDRRADLAGACSRQAARRALAAVRRIPRRAPRPADARALWRRVPHAIPAPLFLLAAYTGVQVAIELCRGYAAVDVLRDWSVVYYAAFAVLAYTTCTRLRVWERPDPLVRWLPRLAVAAVACVLVAVVVGLAWTRQVGVLGARVEPFKPSDASVVALLLVVLWLWRRVPTALACLLALPVLAGTAAQSRAVLVSVVLTVVLFRRWRRMRVAVLVLATAVLLCALLDVRLPTEYREVSARQLAWNAVSTVVPSQHGGDERLSVNSSWRLRWWGDITRDAAHHGSVFTGTGWHTNLAIRYHFSTAGAGWQALRHPHNAAMGILGRGGAIPLGLWIATYACLLARLARTRRVLTGHPNGLLVDVAFVAVCAGLVDGLTDVFLEAPQDAIPHWTLVGLGLAVARGVTARPAAPGTTAPTTEPAVTAAEVTPAGPPEEVRVG